MVRRKLTLPPEYVYPTDEWRIRENRFFPRFMAQTETIFSLGNGYLGMRGNFEEGRPVVQNGTFVNAFYESWPIVYGENAHGFAKTGQTIVNVVDTKVIRLYVDDEPFFLPTADLLSFERTLDLKAGTLDREVVWETAAGKTILIQSRRLVSFQHRHLAAISYQVTVVNGKAPVVISSEMIGDQPTQTSAADPRGARGFAHKILVPKASQLHDLRVVQGYITQNSKMTLACGMDHVIETECSYSAKNEDSEDAQGVVFSIDALQGKPIQLFKYVTYHTSRSARPGELCARAQRSLDRAVSHGFDDLLEDQRQYLDTFWGRSDVQVEVDPGQARRSTTRIQQAIRWNLFQILQATGRAEGTGVPAKGLTGQAYEGHYFWDTEIYLLPFLIYTAPRIARNLLKFRHSMLDKARQRAREVNQKGALFPWRTINGEEASAYYAAGTAQYHINADIMYALRKYVDATGDEDFLYEEGVEMLVETARLWADLGFYSERKGGRFCIHGVTGPDEYNTVVNNNTYTNLMARENLRYAAVTVELLQSEHPEQFEALIDRTGLQLEEVEEWKAAARGMYIPLDESSGVHPQDDNFLDREMWDFENTPPEKYPLLLSHHPLVIYRHQVIKQADVVLALYLLGNEFSAEAKKRNFDYYDPITTGDSSLSACIQSIVASEIGDTEKAMEYARYAILMDLGNVGGNVSDGCHVASIGGTWMVFVYGFAGMRDYGGRLRFRPRLPRQFKRLRFPLAIRGQVLDVDITQDTATYGLRNGTELIITHEGEEVRLSAGTPVSIERQPSATA